MRGSADDDGDAAGGTDDGLSGGVDAGVRGSVRAPRLAAARLSRRRCRAIAAQAQDLLQETFLQIHRSRHAYRADLPVRPWVFTIARHVWLMDRRLRGPAAHVRQPSCRTLPVPPEVEGLADRDRLDRALERRAARSPRSAAAPSRVGLQLRRDRSDARHPSRRGKASIEPWHGRPAPAADGGRCVADTTSTSAGELRAIVARDLRPVSAAAAAVRGASWRSCLSPIALLVAAVRASSACAAMRRARPGVDVGGVDAADVRRPAARRGRAARSSAGNDAAAARRSGATIGTALDRRDRDHDA